ncbi:MAG TPA: phosphoribosylanthranilate isomerase [Tahibacter sp.]|uniref:phosphoribosylanthranilate isomerase n=1 Tax=Tahibacter sp. TaxID=2056211 RepID=UPI002CF656E7|nr:phosphoribosylanthranilate isomerase [Tahibacter sp.]HSX62986.1 phosphoribosylanthranilate isomerase [Tahibacter sp.]
MNERVRVKFCGFTRAGDVAEACALGVDAIGLIMTRRSRRFVDIEQAAALRAAVPPFVAVVTLLLDDEAAWVDEVISRVAPDLLQFHGDEPAERCAAFGRRYLKAVPMGSVADVHAYVRSHPQAAGFLLDSHVAGGQGGSGVAFDWTRVPRDLARPLLLAGGLDAGNVAQAVRVAQPFAVDVSSGIESAPGIKCAQKMRQFMQSLRRDRTDEGTFA